MSALIFLGILATMVALAFLVSRMTGARAHYIEDWRPDDGEQILFEDRQADIHVLTGHEARFTSFARLRRGFVIVTNRRILAGTRALFSRRSMIQYMMYVGQAPGEDSQSLHGGLLTRGFQTFVLERGTIRRVFEGKARFVELKPSPAVRSSFNRRAIRIYTDRAELFPFSE